MTTVKLKTLKNTLIRKGVAYKHASRYVRELEHHYDDLFVDAKARGLDDRTAAFMAEQALGDEAALVHEMASRPELQSFGQRYPKVCYLALPVILYLLVGVGALLVFAGMMETFFPSAAENYAEPATWVKSAVEYFRLFLMHALAPLLSLLFLFYGLRNQISRKILYSGIFLANLLACALLIRIQWPDPAAGITQGSLGATFGYGLYDIKGVMDTKFRLLLTLAVLALSGWCYRQYLIRD
jgi:hypothetical protein